MIDLLYWSFLAALLPPIVLDVCVKILSAAGGHASGQAIDRSRRIVTLTSPSVSRTRGGGHLTLNYRTPNMRKHLVTRFHGGNL